MNIEKELEKSLRPLLDKVNSFKLSNKRVYAMWMAQTYYYALHSTSILGLAGVRSDSQVLKRRFFAHAGEEDSHEKLALKDVELMGFNIDEFPELESTKAMYQTQYFQIENYGSDAFFGWVIALEGLAVKACEGLYKRAAKEHGEKSSKFLRVHAEEDPDHFEKALAQLKTIDNKELMIQNMKDTIARYHQILNDCEEFGEFENLNQAA